MGALILACGAVIVSLGCGAANLSSAPNIQSKGLIRIAISPSSTSLAPDGQEHFTATVTGASNSAVNWSTSEGSISTNGTFTSPSKTTGLPITITAVSVADPSQRATGLVTIVANTRLSISTSSLTQAFLNTPYDSSLAATGGTPPYSWTVSAGSLPAGLKLSTDGFFLGMPTRLGKFSFSATVTDATSSSVTKAFTLGVSTRVNGNFDGPAELPRVYLNTAIADTPAPGSTTTVVAGGDLQSALDNAHCGDTIKLQAGATFTHPTFTLPAKACDDQHWIIIRTSTPDFSLPAEGTRMTPCYAGVASLPGRPAYPCPHPQHLLATVTSSGSGDGPIIFANGANHYRLLGLEISRSANNGKSVGGLIAPATDASMDRIVLDRLYVHGTPTDETRRGVRLTGGTNIAVQDSYISELHCNASVGTCVDSQAISGGGTGSLPTGPLKIDHNFLEAAGENILFGGGAATQTPSDIEIRFNHLFKPMFWMPGQPGFKDPAFIVKNHFEVKNAQRVLFDSNLLENTWGGFSQHGYSILINPKNEYLNNASVCPTCQVTDVTIRYVTISHVGGGFEIANGLDAPTADPPLQGQRYSIHDVIVDDIDQVKYSGYGNFAQISTIATPLLQNVSINHVTAFPTHVLLNVGGPPAVTMPGFAFTNSIVAAGDSALRSTGQFGDADCAHTDVPITVIEQCFSGYSVAPNAIISSPTQFPPSKWPSGLTFYNSPNDVGFVRYQNGNGGDYHLLPTSSAKGAASDGTDLGANVDAILAAISSVQ